MPSSRHRHVERRRKHAVAKAFKKPAGSNPEFSSEGGSRAVSGGRSQTQGNAGFNWNYLIIAVLVIVVVGGGYMAFSRKDTPTTTASTTPPPPVPEKKDVVSLTPDKGLQPASNPTPPPPPAGELKTVDEVIGKGKTAEPGKTVKVHYVGTLTDGTKFDSSRDINRPFEFVLGSGQVIQGWEQGIKGMKVGGKRKLTVPPSLGYGAQPNGKIPANSVLNFEVELLDVK